MSREGGAVGSRGTMTKGHHQAKFAREGMPAGGQAEMWSTKAKVIRLQTRGNSNAYGQIEFCRDDLQLGPKAQAAENAEKEENIPTHPGSRAVGKRTGEPEPGKAREPP